MSIYSVKSDLLERADKTRNSTVKNYVKRDLMKKVNQAEDSGGFFLEQLEKNFKNLKPEGLMKGWKPADFDDLWFVLTGSKKKKAHSKIAKIAKIADRVAGSIWGESE